MPLTDTEHESLVKDLADLLNKYRATSPATPPPASLGGYAVAAVEQLPDGFDHRWPNATIATSYRPTEHVPTARYTVRTAEGDYSLLIGAEEGGRRTHGLTGRGRIVVFVQRRSAQGTGGLYPLVEFAEADTPGPDGLPLYAAGIPKIAAPRSLSTGRDLEGLRQVPHLQEADIRKAEDVYDAMASGPTLRLMVRVDDIDAMLLHALWVGGLRGGGRLPRPA